MSVNAVQCFVEIYTYEGQSLVLGQQYVRSVSTQANIRSSGGSFEISLRPGGPGGVDSVPTWAEIITPMSLVVIGMSRGGYQQIIMIGLATATEEGQVWSGNRVERNTVISGVDFSYFFNTFNYYTLGVLGATAGALVGESSPFGDAVGVPALLGQGYNNVPPDQMGIRFYNDAMAGPSAILAKTIIPYRDGYHHLRDVLGTYAEPYPGVKIPFSATFAATEGSWISKFLTIFPFPFYEFFIATAPLGFYGATTQASNLPASDKQAFGLPFTMQAMPGAQPSSPVMVARVNPLPAFNVTVKGGSSGFSFDSLDMTRWSGLPRYTSPSAFLSSRVGYAVEEVRNFYQLNPIAMRGLAQDSNTGTVNWGFASAAALDPYSVNRYGYRPEITDTYWFYSPDGVAQQDPAYNADLTAATLLSKVCSYYEPTPFMLRADVTLNLRPDILMGGVFTYFPFKAQNSYDFYVEGVAHTFDFERQQAVTNLNLSRGLPSATYADAAASGTLMALHVGNAQRHGNNFTIGVPAGQGPALIAFGPGSQLRQFLGALSPAFSTPQSLPGS